MKMSFLSLGNIINHSIMDKWMIITVLFVLLSAQQLRASQPKLLHRFKDARAEKRFCAQKRFDGASFDGIFYKFFSYRSLPSGKECCPKYIWDEYRIKYDPDRDEFTYSALVYDYENTLPMSGMYMNIIDTYIEFYANKYRKSSLFSCSNANITNCENNDIFGECKSISNDDFDKWKLNQCTSSETGQDIYETIFKKSILNSFELKVEREGTNFASIYDGQRIVYILSEIREASSLNSMKLNYPKLPDKTEWFFKPFENATEHEVIGSIPWKFKSGQTTFFAVINWLRDSSDVRIIPLIRKGTLELTEKQILLKAFFGCPNSSKSSNSNVERRSDSLFKPVNNNEKNSILSKEIISEKKTTIERKETIAPSFLNVEEPRKEFAKSILPPESLESSSDSKSGSFSTSFIMFMLTIFLFILVLIMYGTVSYYKKHLHLSSQMKVRLQKENEAAKERHF